MNSVDVFGRSPMFEAAENGHKEVVWELKRAGGIVKAPYEELSEVILNCAKENDVETLDLFCEAGVKNLNEYVTCDRRNIGHIAVFFNSVEIISYLKRKTNFDFARKDRWGKTVYDEATERNSKQITKILK